MRNAATSGEALAPIDGTGIYRMATTCGQYKVSYISRYASLILKPF